MSRMCVIGAGYVGLVSALHFAERGHAVVCLDINQAKLASLRDGVVPFHEPYLAQLLREQQQLGNITFSADYAASVPGAEFVFIAVDTPSGAEGQADLMAVRAAARGVARVMSPGVIIVNKSTVPIGTGDLVGSIIERETDVPFSVVSNPEFLREGSALADVRRPDRVILGSEDVAAAERVASLYAGMGCPVMITNTRTAEMIKYASNAFLATRISFINEIGTICERLGADVMDVALGMGHDHRIGHHFLAAGIGWGGSCFPKDVRALIHMAGARGAHPQLLRAVVDINRDQRLAVVQKLETLLGGLDDRTITLLGLSFKPDTDDLRNAPSVELVELLHHEGCHIRAYDPVALQRARSVLPCVELCDGPYSAASGADAVVLVTEWEEFRHLDLIRLHSVMHTPVVVDGRNLFDPEHMRRHGFVYAGMGRGHVAEPRAAGSPPTTSPVRALTLAGIAPSA